MKKIKEHDLVIVKSEDGSRAGTVVHIYNVETVSKDQIKTVLK